MAYFDTRRKEWVARDGSGDRHYIGSFDTREEAEEKELEYKTSKSPLLNAARVDPIQEQIPTGLYALVNEKGLWEKLKSLFGRL